MVAAAKLLHKQERLSYREIAARLFEAGHINKHGDPCVIDQEHAADMTTPSSATPRAALWRASLAEMTSAPDAVTAAMKAAKQLSEIVWDDRRVGFA